MPACIYLPSLKAFGIGGVKLHENFTQELLIGCPSLEIIHICSCDLYFSSISSNMLKELDIVECHQYEPMQISCPSLCYLYITCHYRDAGISLKNVKSLRIASMGLSTKGRYFGSGYVSVLNFLSALSDAAQLIALSFHINNPRIKVQLERGVLSCRNFNNLKELYIVMLAISFDFNLMASLLKHSPNVETLSLTLNVSQVAIQEEQRQEVLGDVLFRHKFIETVIIRDPHMDIVPLDLVETFMKTLNAYITEIGNVIFQ